MSLTAKHAADRLAVARVYLLQALQEYRTLRATSDVTPLALTDARAHLRDAFAFRRSARQAVLSLRSHLQARPWAQPSLATPSASSARFQARLTTDMSTAAPAFDDLLARLDVAAAAAEAQPKANPPLAEPTVTPPVQAPLIPSLTDMNSISRTTRRLYAA